MNVYWQTPAGLIATVIKNTSFEYEFLCYTNNEPANFTIISGQLPDGLYLDGLYLYGIVPYDVLSGVYNFTIRITSKAGMVVDRSFAIDVVNVSDSTLFPNSNIGIFPDGKIIKANVTPLFYMPEFNSNIVISGGNFPNFLSLNSNTGSIYGYIDPTYLYSSANINPNMEYGKPDLPNSNTTTFTFFVSYNSNANIEYSMTAMPYNKFYGNSISNVDYHPPMILNSNATVNVSGQHFSFQPVTKDFEYNSTSYTLLSSGNIPGNVSINSTTGIVTGIINRDTITQEDYNITYTASKTSNSSYHSNGNITLNILAPDVEKISWYGNPYLGNIVAGMPSSLSVHANIIAPLSTRTIVPATANCTLKVVGANIIFGGDNFTNGSFILVEGGSCNTVANLVVSNTSNGSITGITINSEYQQYTQLPSSLTYVWQNPDGESENAIIELDFGIDTINIIDTGDFYDTATIGIADAGQTTNPIINAIIYDGHIANTSIENTGNNFQVIPAITIEGISTIQKINSIVYSLDNSSLPDGLELKDNGMIVGRVLPQTPNITECYFSITATAAHYITSSQGYVCTVVSESPAPLTNLWMEVFLDKHDYDAIYSATHDQSVIKNTDIFRPDDFYFGIPDQQHILMAYGIYPTTSNIIVQAVQKYHSEKQFLFTDIKWAQSTTEGYEVLYIQPLDIYTNTEGITFSGDITTNKAVGYPATLPNIMDRLVSHLSASNDALIPTWMSDTQPDGTVIGFIPAIPIAYVKPNTGKRIQFYLQKYFDNNYPLNTITALSDRYVWNCGYSENWNCTPQYVVTGYNPSDVSFANGSFTINSSIPTSTYSNLYPIAYEWLGNVTIDIADGEIVSNINAMAIDGISANINAIGNIQLINNYGTPFLLYDGVNSPLHSFGLLSNASIIEAGWNVNGSNVFLQEDEGSMYIEFPKTK
jgi:SOS-response transcriptional repressor LexA